MIDSRIDRYRKCLELFGEIEGLMAGDFEEGATFDEGGQYAEDTIRNCLVFFRSNPWSWSMKFAGLMLVARDLVRGRLGEEEKKAGAPRP